MCLSDGLSLSILGIHRFVTATKPVSLGGRYNILQFRTGSLEMFFSEFPTKLADPKLCGGLFLQSVCNDNSKLP